MPFPAVEKAIEIAAPPDAVWRVLTEPALLSRWLNHAEVEATWLPGSPITLRHELSGHAFADRGTVLVAERPRRLSYSHWAEVDEVPDLPENRTLFTFTLEPKGEATHLTVRHEGFRTEVAQKHANFFWGGAIHDVKRLAEAQP